MLGAEARTQAACSKLQCVYLNVLHYEACAIFVGTGFINVEIVTLNQETLCSIQDQGRRAGTFFPWPQELAET